MDMQSNSIARWRKRIEMVENKSNENSNKTRNLRSMLFRFFSIFVCDVKTHELRKISQCFLFWVMDLYFFYFNEKLRARAGKGVA